MEMAEKKEKEQEKNTRRSSQEARKPQANRRGSLVDSSGKKSAGHSQTSVSLGTTEGNEVAVNAKEAKFMPRVHTSIEHQGHVTDPDKDETPKAESKEKAVEADAKEE